MDCSRKKGESSSQLFFHSLSHSFSLTLSLFTLSLSLSLSIYLSYSSSRTLSLYTLISLSLSFFNIFLLFHVLFLLNVSLYLFFAYPKHSFFLFSFSSFSSSHSLGFTGTSHLFFAECQVLNSLSFQSQNWSNADSTGPLSKFQNPFSAFPYLDWCVSVCVNVCVCVC